MQDLQKLSPDVIFNIKPQVFKAKWVGPFWNKTGGFSITLEVDSKGFSLKRKSGAVMAGQKWGELRELNNMVRPKGRFSYYGDWRNWNMKGTSVINEGKGKARIVLEGEREEWEKLAAIFDQLPVETAARKCNVCSGPVIDGICRDCGKSFRAAQRSRGLKFLLAGIAVEALGIILTASSESGGNITIYIGLIIIGLVLMIFGAVGVIFGVRIT